MKVNVAILILGFVAFPLINTYAAENKEKIPLEAVTLADERLNLCLDNLATENGWKTTQEVTGLYCTGVDTLSGIEIFSQLQEASINIGYTHDLSPLIFSKKVNKLTLEDLAIRDISPLHGLNQLEFLNLGGNSLHDIQLLGELKALKTLYLYEANIKDISALSGLNHLTALDLNFNQIKVVGDLGQLKKLKSLNLTAGLAKNVDPHELIAPINDLKNLEHINLAANSIYDASALSDLNNLTFIDLSANQIQNLAFLKNKTQLKILYLNNNMIYQWDYLTQLPELETINLRSNSLETIPDEVIDAFAQTMPHLKEMDISNNPIQNCEDVEKLTQTLPNTTIIAPAHCGF